MMIGMKESIFFNREQLKIIRWYGIQYSILLKYGLFIIAWGISLLLSWWILILASWDTQALSLWEEYDNIQDTQHIREEYKKKQSITKTLSGINAINLEGSVSYLSWHLKGQDVLLEIKWQVLPRQFSIKYSDFAKIAEKNQENFEEKDLNNFFFTVIKSPLDETFNTTTNNLLELSGSLYDTFWIWCINSASKFSFVCKHYVSQFLDQFFFYKLATKQKKADENQENNGLENWSSNKDTFHELNKIYEKIKYNPSQKKKLCEGIILYGEYWGYLDDNLTTIMRSCWTEEYTRFLFLRDFSALSDGFRVGFIDAKIYPNNLLNQYKLYSTQQLLYKQLSSSVDSKVVMRSYFQFLHEILTKEWNRKSELLPQFAKSFSYRYNINILSPYLKDEKSKMSKEDRSFLMSQLLSLNYGDKVNNFIGLEERAGYKMTNIETQEIEKQKIDLEKLFRSSYLPNSFSLTSVKKLGENELLVKGIDSKTTMTVEAKMIYKDIQLSVSEIKVENNNKLSEYMNALIANDRISLNKVLNLLYENKDIAEQTQKLNLDLCSQLKGKFENNLLSCNEKQVVISRGNEKETEKNVRYTFGLNNGSLSSLQVSDKILEIKLLKEINFRLIDSTTTYYMISSLVDYQPKEDDSGFWMKEHLLTIDKFAKYLGITPDSVIIEGALAKVSFKIQDISFQASYNPINNELNPIALDFGTKHRPIIVQGFTLKLEDGSVDEINRFANKPLEVLKKINSALVKRYFPKE